MIHACHRAALAGCHVLIMCPTGTLVHSYRDRVPDHPNIVIETIHSALIIKRQYDSAVQYAPPSRLRRYDLIMIDEVLQIDDELLEKLRMAISELPQRPVPQYPATSINWGLWPGNGLFCSGYTMTSPMRRSRNAFAPTIQHYAIS